MKINLVFIYIIFTFVFTIQLTLIFMQINNHVDFLKELPNLAKQADKFGDRPMAALLFALCGARGDLHAMILLCNSVSKCLKEEILPLSHKED